MGLIKALVTATSTTLADQWKEYFYCDSIASDTLVVKGQKRVGKKSSNTKGSDNIISNGSGIVVNDGQCMIIVDQGKVVELTAEAGQYTYDKSSESSVFTGSLGESLGNFFKTIGRRITYGGDTGKDQRVYYFNLKELTDNKFGTQNPVPFRCVDSKIGMDLDVQLRCNGVFSYKIANPILFYQNVCGNVTDSYKRTNLDTQLRTEFISALQPGLGALSELELRPNQIIAHTTELEQAMNKALSEKWVNTRGLEIVSIALGSITLTPEDQALITKAQQTAMYRDPNMAAATLVQAQAEAMKNAASNSNGAMMGFMGMGLAQQAGGVNTKDLFAMGAAQNAQAQAKQAPSADSWKCSCGATNTGKFCMNCGAAKPAASKGWTCSCGAVNLGKFCTNCGAKKPADAPLYRCDKCGWEPVDPKNPPKFCPNCGDPFTDDDITNK